MNRRILSLVTLVSLIGCGDPSDPLVGEAECTSSGIASLGIDPLGRGDGIDITESNYKGRCYEDDEMEANRPQLPDPRMLMAEEAEELARQSQAAADAARALLEIAQEELEASLSVQANPPASGSQAWNKYVVLVTGAKFVTEEAYQIGLSLLSPESTTTWQDIADHPEKLIQGLANEFLEESAALFETNALVDFATYALTAIVKAEMLEFLKEARDAALALYEALPASDQISETMQPTVDPAALLAVEDAQREYDEALAKAIADSNAAFEALLFAHNTPSDLPPCDSEELRKMLDESLCQVPFVNPVTPEEEEMLPGITAAIDAYVAELCDAVDLSCELEE